MTNLWQPIPSGGEHHGVMEKLRVLSGKLPPPPTPFQKPSFELIGVPYGDPQPFPYLTIRHEKHPCLFTIWPPDINELAAWLRKIHAVHVSRCAGEPWQTPFNRAVEIPPVPYRSVMVGTQENDICLNVFPNWNLQPRRFELFVMGSESRQLALYLWQLADVFEENDAPIIPTEGQES